MKTVIVPVEPTPEMLMCGASAANQSVADIWHSMIDAAALSAPPAPDMREAFEAWLDSPCTASENPVPWLYYNPSMKPLLWATWQAAQPSRVAPLPPCAECGAKLRCSYDWHHKVSAPPDEKPTDEQRGALKPTVTHGTGVPK